MITYSKKTSSSGFSLIEVMIAMMILAGAMVALSQSWQGSLFSFRKAQNVNTIVSLLKKKTTELEIKYKSKSFSEIPEDESGDFGAEYPEFTWVSKTKDLEFPDLSQILISKEGGANDTVLMVIKQMTDFISKATKELKVSVVWKSNNKEVTYSVVTYLVNNLGAGTIGPGAGSADANAATTTSLAGAKP